jgi:hypothetical protein
MRRALLVTLVLTACGGDDGFGLGNVPIDGIGDAFEGALCHHAAMCNLFPDEATCRQANLGFAFAIDPSLVAAIEAGKVRYDGNAVGDCYEAYGNASCDRTDLDGRTLSGACAGAISGTVDAGGQCAIDEECISQTCDVPQCPDACCQGTCTGSTPPGQQLPIGATCQSTQDCATNGFCDQTTKACTALKLAGATCSSLTDCAYGLGCAGTPRTCKPLPAVGEACPDMMCRDEGTFCDPATMLCANVGLPGDPCTATTSQSCSTYYTCDPATMQCARGPGLGEACTPARRCFDGGTYCKAGTCAQLEPKGATCMNDGDCANNYCEPMLNVCADEPICI